MLFVHGNVVLLLLTSLCLLFLQFQYLPILSYKVGEEREGKNRVGGGDSSTVRAAVTILQLGKIKTRRFMKTMTKLHLLMTITQA